MKNVSNKVFLRQLKKVGACQEAVEWVFEHGGDAKELFRDCKRGDWMAWIIAKMELVTKREMVGALADIAALSLKYYEKEYPKDKNVRECINTCRRYAKGKATDKELEVAAYAAAHAVNAAAHAVNAADHAAHAADHAAHAAAYAAYALANAANALANALVNAADHAAYAAAYAAANAAAYAVAREKTLKKCADILRRHFPDLVKG